jgi:hypothetical protein
LFLQLDRQAATLLALPLVLHYTVLRSSLLSLTFPLNAIVNEEILEFRDIELAGLAEGFLGKVGKVDLVCFP